MARTSKKPKKVWIQQQLDLVATPHDVPRLGAYRPEGLYHCHGAAHRTMARVSYANYSERADRRAEVLPL
jgi:hypothetical protein